MWKENLMTEMAQKLSIKVYADFTHEYFRLLGQDRVALI